MSNQFDWKDLFHKGESPYFAMFRCGCMGIKIEECIKHCQEKDIPLREKDIRSWQDGNWKNQIKTRGFSVLNPLVRTGYERTIPVLGSFLSDFQTWPTGWTGTSRRWFPCNEDNIPMQKWGYLPGHSPTLYEIETAKALSPVNWVGQNIYAQPFIVIDIDGVGHGETDMQVIEFGNKFRDLTETWENPKKPGSFHLYFKTDRQIPISHFSFAKLDLMGNQKNAAVYMKDKISNGVERRGLDENIWKELQNYLSVRKAQREGALR